MAEARNARLPLQCANGSESHGRKNRPLGTPASLGGKALRINVVAILNSCRRDA
jgi:hypothetical protein